MKQGTIEVTIKGTSVVLKAGCLSLGQALAQWVHTGEWPDEMTWILIWAFVGAAVWDSLSNFMSGTYERWKNTGTLNGNGTETKALELPKP